MAGRSSPQSYRRSEQRFFEIVEEVQEANEDADPDEVMDLVLEAQQAVRAEMAVESKSKMVQ
jgi:hypothetical protein